MSGSKWRRRTKCRGGRRLQRNYRSSCDIRWKLRFIKFLVKKDIQGWYDSILPLFAIITAFSHIAWLRMLFLLFLYLYMIQIQFYFFWICKKFLNRFCIVLTGFIGNIIQKHLFQRIVPTFDIFHNIIFKVGCGQ